MRLFNVAPVADPEDPFRSKSKSTLKLGKRLGSASIASTHEAKKAQAAMDLTEMLDQNHLVGLVEWLVAMPSH